MKQLTGIVLSRKTFFEKDILLEVFTISHGKIKILGKNCAGSKRRRLPDTAVEAQFSLTKGSAFWIVSQVSIVTGFYALREQFNTLCMAAHFIDILRKATPFEHPNSELYALLSLHLHKLALGEDLAQTQLSFYASFLECEGLAHVEESVSERTFKLAFESYTQLPFCPPLHIASANATMG